MGTRTATRTGSTGTGGTGGGSVDFAANSIACTSFPVDIPEKPAKSKKSKAIALMPVRNVGSIDTEMESTNGTPQAKEKVNKPAVAVNMTRTYMTGGESSSAGVSDSNGSGSLSLTVVSASKCVV